ncbi:T9SS type A sorting domain-containing protein, partial [Klebsiella pneumoniae]|uniref:T9SS type A sorting domain-containing protein n=1 Tax=Klebsiella pneumoniae TaxID=573 RepID=UPI00117AC3D5
PVTLRMTEHSGAEVAIYNLSGTLVKKVTVRNAQFTLSEFGIANGVYVVKTQQIILNDAP